MNRDQAIQILLLHRPGGEGADASELAEALELARRDPALREWYEAHRAFQEKVRAGFREAPVPAGLREQILSERPRQTAAWKPALVAVVMLVLLAQLVVYTAQWMRHRDATRYPAYRRQMVTFTTSPYAMSLTTNSSAAIRSYLAAASSPADFVLPPNVQKLDLIGCMTTDWGAHKVSLICLRREKGLPGAEGDVWLFVADEHVAGGAPKSTRPRYLAVDGMATASWAADGKSYLLVARGQRPVIKDLLGGELD